ncbi:MAG TPA: hypothetical protein DC000_08505 [Clostridiales bacterium]|nr:hypothetical protein [Clostridiales bacterium]
MLLLFKKDENMKKSVSWILIGVGVLILCFALFQKVTTTYYENKIINEYTEYIDNLKDQKMLSAEEPSIVEKPDVLEESTQINEKSYETQSEIKQENIKRFDDHEISGIIEIPNIKVSAAILEGTDDKALKYSVGHYPETAQPGEVGNCVLLGHRNYLYGHFFRRLDELEKGDEIIIKKDENTYTYIVSESFVVSPENVWVLDQTSDSIITMITCTPIGTYTDRLIVRGVLLE